MIYKPADTVSVKSAVSVSPEWIRHPDGEANRFYVLEKDSCLDSVTSGELILCSYGYCEVYINGNLAVRYSERSYLFDLPYSVYDVTSFLVPGENRFSVLYEDSGEKTHSGILFELRVRNGEKITKINSGKGWQSSVFKPMGKASYFIHGFNAEERYDARLGDGTPYPRSDNAVPVERLGNKKERELPTEYHRSPLLPQTEDFIYPEKLLSLELSYPSPGVGFRFSASSPLSVFVSEIQGEDVTVTTSFGKIQELYLDGAPVRENERIPLNGKKHLLCLRTGGADVLFGSERELLFTPVGITGTGSFSLLDVKLPPVKRYPWNEPRVLPRVPEYVSALLNAGNALQIEPSTLSLLTVASTPRPGITHELVTNKYYNGGEYFTDERVASHSPRIKDASLPARVLRAEALTGKKPTVIKAGDAAVHFLLDMGRELIGLFSFDITAAEGTRIIIHGFEMIADDGVRFMSGRSTLEYTCREGKNVFISHVRRGARYLSVSVTGGGDTVINRIGMTETRYPAEKRGDFKCSDKTLERIDEICLNTAKVCMLDKYVDCPGFEQNVWTGDARITAIINMLSFGCYTFDSDYLRLISESLDKNLALIYRKNNPRYREPVYLTCAAFPTYPDEGIPIWSFSWLLQIRDNYMITGDIRFLKSIFPAVEEMLRRCARLINNRGLFSLNGSWNLIEWADNDLPFYGEVTANSAMLSYCFSEAAALAAELGKKSLSSSYSKLSGDIRTAINKYCWDGDREAYVDTVRDEAAYENYVSYMKECKRKVLSYEEFASRGRISVQTNTLAYLFDCVPRDRTQKTVRFLIHNLSNGKYRAGTPANLPETGATAQAPGEYVPVGSPFFLFYALEALFKLGLGELALSAVKRDWGEMLSDGLATCVENFKNNGHWARSAAHGWSASPSVFFRCEVLGVKPVLPGYREFTVEPVAGELTSASGSVVTPYGLIEVSWKKDKAGRIKIKCKSPSECKRVII